MNIFLIFFKTERSLLILLCRLQLVSAHCDFHRLHIAVLGHKANIHRPTVCHHNITEWHKSSGDKLVLHTFIGDSRKLIIQLDNKGVCKISSLLKILIFWLTNDGTHRTWVKKTTFWMCMHLENKLKELIAVKSSTHTQALSQTHTQHKQLLHQFVPWWKLLLLNESRWCRNLKSGARGDSCWAEKLSPSLSHPVDSKCWKNPVTKLVKVLFPCLEAVHDRQLTEEDLFPLGFIFLGHGALWFSHQTQHLWPSSLFDKCPSNVCCRPWNKTVLCARSPRCWDAKASLISHYR